MTGKPRTAIAFQTHLFDRGMARVFDRLRRQVPPHFDPYVLMHVPPGTPKPRRLHDVPHHFVTTPEVRAQPYPTKTADRDSQGRPWVLWAGGHCDLIPLHFRNAHPEYERYWVVEFDIRFTGHWSRLFDAFEESDADFLGAALRTHAEHPNWECWETLQFPPGDVPAQDRRVRAFMPLYRVSRRGAEAVDAAYRAGWGGHLEAAWPTIIASRGLVLEDIGGCGGFVRPGNGDRFYTCACSDVAYDPHAPGTLIAFPTMFRPGSTPNRLYHPVKPFRLRAELRGAFMAARVWQGAKRRALLAWLRGRRGATAPRPPPAPP